MQRDLKRVTLCSLPELQCTLVGLIKLMQSNDAQEAESMRAFETEKGKPIQKVMLQG